MLLSACAGACQNSHLRGCFRAYLPCNLSLKRVDNTGWHTQALNLRHARALYLQAVCLIGRAQPREWLVTAEDDGRGVPAPVLHLSLSTSVSGVVFADVKVRHSLIGSIL